MYILHYAPDNASLIIRLVLDEMNQPFRTELVDRRANAQSSQAYLALNPTGLIPTLITPDGPLSETAAILLWLSERHKTMAPQLGDPNRAAFLKWLVFTSNTLHADLRMLFYPQTYAGPDAQAQRALHTTVTARVTRHYALLQDQLGAPWFGGDTPSVLDWYVTVTRRWAALYAPLGRDWFDPAHHAGLQALAARLETRPAAQRATLAEGLGSHPFTAPGPCTPPEGAAL